MDSMISEMSDEQTTELTESRTADGVHGEQSFIERFDITVGEVRVEVDVSGERRWMWKAETSDGACSVSGTIFDAVMGAIEEQTGGEL